jgi:hypothetical protein
MVRQAASKQAMRREHTAKRGPMSNKQASHVQGTYGKEGTDVDVEANVGEGGSNNLGAAVMPVLAHLGHQDAGRAALLLGKRLPND